MAGDGRQRQGTSLRPRSTVIVVSRKKKEIDRMRTAERLHGNFATDSVLLVFGAVHYVYYSFDDAH